VRKMAESFAQREKAMCQSLRKKGYYSEEKQRDEGACRRSTSYRITSESGLWRDVSLFQLIGQDIGDKDSM